MMKKTIFSILLLSLLLPIMIKAQESVIIKGIVEGDFKGYDKVYIYGNGIERDSVSILNGRFEFRLSFSKPMVIQLYCEYEAKLKDGLSPIAIFADQPGVIYYKDVNIERGFHTGKASGMKSVDAYTLHNQNLSKVSKQIQVEMAKKYGEGISAEAPEYKSYLAEYSELNKMRSNKVIAAHVKTNPDAYLSALILTSGMASMSPAELERNYNLLSKRVATSEYGKMIADFLTGSKRSEVGQVLADFTLNDAEDKPFAFSQLKGKYVMIDFWASWCGPCKISFPHMKELYKQYKCDQFEIYSISVDQSKSDWLKELERQKLPWLHALDTKGLAKSMFGVNGVPTVFLIGPDGHILMKAVGIDPKGNGPVEKKLMEIFPSSKPEGINKTI